MFILRIVEKESTTNIELGQSYEVGHSGSEIFDEYLAINEWCDGDTVKCVIETPTIDEGIHINKNQRAYIMTESGQTFERL